MRYFSYILLQGCLIDWDEPRTSPYYDTSWAWPRNQWDGPPGSEGNPVYKGDIDLELRSGYLTGGGNFLENSPVLYIDPQGGHNFIQISATPSNYEEYDLDLVRVHFTSNRIEWVAGDQYGSYVFPSQEECQSYGLYCDPVVAAEGNSGFSDLSNGEISANINAHCNHVGLPYSYIIEAYAYDFSSLENVTISQIHNIEIYR